MKTIEEINHRIKKGKVVVLTAGEVKKLARKEGTKEMANKVDVVTSGTFGAMCSSGAFLNLGHTSPRIKMGGGKVYLNDVPAYTGLAAVDVYLGATALPDDDPRNKDYPGEFRYGGGHVIEELVRGNNVRLSATGYGTDCYPRKRLERDIDLKTMGDAILFNVRNACQNYEVGVNLGDRPIYTYMGMLKPHLGNANYSTAGELSPLLNDPYYKTIGLGTRVFLGGGIGYVAWHGTQHHPEVLRGENGVPRSPAGTLALIGDLKQMSREWLRGVSFRGYGATLTVGIGVPVPILSEEVLNYTLVRDEDIFAPVIDFSEAYPQGKDEVLCEVSYAELGSGKIQVGEVEVPTASLSSYFKADEICHILKGWIEEGRFLLTPPSAPLLGVESGVRFGHNP